MELEEEILRFVCIFNPVRRLTSACYYTNLPRKNPAGENQAASLLRQTYFSTTSLMARLELSKYARLLINLLQEIVRLDLKGWSTPSSDNRIGVSRVN